MSKISLSGAVAGLSSGNLTRLRPDFTVLKGMPEREYRANKALSRSSLEKLRKSPLHLKWSLDNEQPDESYFRFGRLAHAAVLEHARFWPTTVIWDGARRYGKVWDEFCAQNEGKEILTAEEESSLLFIGEAVRRHPVYANIHESDVEVSIFWTDPDTGVRCKARPDCLGLDGVMYDLKTTQDASAAFEDSIIKYGYHRQAAWYLDAANAAGMGIKDFVFIAVEKEAPFGVQTFALDESLIEQGRAENRAALQVFSDCLKSGNWPGYPVTTRRVAK